MNSENPIAVVLNWHRAVNSHDTAALLALSAVDIEIVGPRGAGYGHDLLRAWLTRAGATFVPRRVFARDSAVVVEQHAIWREPETGKITGEADLASCFTVENGVVTRFERRDSLADALSSGGLTLDDYLEDACPPD